jgi:CheY-like chemotaxis protein
VAQILLVGRDWQARALLRAQLIEDGFDVEAYEDVSEALDSLYSTLPLPVLVLADVSANDDPAEDVKQLSTWATRVPIWIIASRSFTSEKSLQSPGIEKVLFRPVDLGALVEQIKHRLQ